MESQPSPDDVLSRLPAPTRRTRRRPAAKKKTETDSVQGSVQGDEPIDPGQLLDDTIAPEEPRMIEISRSPLADRPASPRDTTPLEMFGEKISPDSIPPLVPPRDLPGVADRATRGPTPRADPQPDRDRESARDSPPEPREAKAPKKRRVRKRQPWEDVPNYQTMEILQRTYEEANLWTQHDMLLRLFPHSKLPTPSDRPLEQIHIIYQEFERRAQITKTLRRYKMVLCLSLAGIELLGVKVFRWPMSGFSMHQYHAMSQYELELYELAKRRCRSGGKSWPPELRICMIMLINMVLYMGVDFFGKRLGETGSDIILKTLGGLLQDSAETPLIDPSTPGGGVFEMMGAAIKSYTQPTEEKKTRRIHMD